MSNNRLDNDNVHLRRAVSSYRSECDRKSGGPSRKCCSNIFNEPPPVIWTVSLLATVGALSERNGRNYRSGTFHSGGETRFQLTGKLLDGKWRPVRGHRANGIDNKQELLRAVRLSGYRRGLARYSWFIDGSRLAQILHLITKIVTRDDKRSTRCTYAYRRVCEYCCTLQRIWKNSLARSKKNKTSYIESHDFLVLCTFFPDDLRTASNPYQARRRDLHGNPELSRWPLRMILSKHACSHTTPIPTTSRVSSC